MNNWISIKKRLPTKLKRVKVMHSMGDIGTMQCFKYESIGYLNPNGHWVVSHKDCIPELQNREMLGYPITHWKEIELND